MNKTLNKKILLTGFILVIILLISLIAKDNQETETIKIGTLVCQSGTCAEWGENSLKGVKLAIKEINDQGGILGRKIELISEDSQEEKVTNTISGYYSLRRQNVDFIIGPSWTPAGLAIHPIVSEDDTIMISTSLGVAEFNEAGDNLFNTWPHDVESTKYLARFVYESGIKKVAILSSTQPWEKTQGEAFEEEFKRVGGTIVAKSEPNAETKEFKTEIAKILIGKPEAIVFTNYTYMASAAKNLSETNFKGKKFSVIMDSVRVEGAAGGFENTIYVQNNPPTKEFIEAFKNEYGVEPGITSDTSYDAVYWITNAIKDSGSLNVNDVKKQMNAYIEYTGASGYMKFDGKGGVIKDSQLYIVKNGKLEIYE